MGVDTLTCVQCLAVGVGSGVPSNLHLLRKLFQFPKVSHVAAFVHSWFSFSRYFLLVCSYELALLKDVMGRYISVCYYKFTILLKFIPFFLSPSSPSFLHPLKFILSFFSPLSLQSSLRLSSPPLPPSSQCYRRPCGFWHGHHRIPHVQTVLMGPG